MRYLTSWYSGEEESDEVIEIVKNSAMERREYKVPGANKENKN
jgi:hypothetical protein